MNDEVKEAAERWMKFMRSKSSKAKDPYWVEWDEPYRRDELQEEDAIVLADAYLAELDETPPSYELLEPLGFVEKDGEWSIRIPSVRMVLSWSPVDATLKEPGDFPMPHTMGQIRTLLRVFGVSKGEKK